MKGLLRQMKMRGEGCCELLGELVIWQHKSVRCGYLWQKGHRGLSSQGKSLFFFGLECVKINRSCGCV